MNRRNDRIPNIRIPRDLNRQLSTKQTARAIALLRIRRIRPAERHRKDVARVCDILTQRHILGNVGEHQCIREDAPAIHERLVLNSISRLNPQSLCARPQSARLRAEIPILGRAQIAIEVRDKGLLDIKDVEDCNSGAERGRVHVAAILEDETGAQAEGGDGGGVVLVFERGHGGRVEEGGGEADVAAAEAVFGACFADAAGPAGGVGGGGEGAGGGGGVTGGEDLGGYVLAGAADADGGCEGPVAVAGCAGHD